MKGLTVEKALRQAHRRLAKRPADAPATEAAALLCLCLDKPRSFLFAWPEHRLSPAEERQFLSLVERRHQGEPLAQILGRREFWSLDLLVGPDTLIPRPETELLVEQVLRRLPEGKPLEVLDLGTGSGAVAAAIAHERPQCAVSATDCSAAALAVAKKNFARLQLNNVQPFHGSWYQALPAPRRFHLIASNPPYVADSDRHLELGDVRREPRTALAGGPDGLNAVRTIVAQAPGYLRPGGWLLIEHGCDQGPAVRELMAQAGIGERETYTDLARLERVTAGRAPFNTK